jgi:hypothetical protein
MWLIAATRLPAEWHKEKEESGAPETKAGGRESMGLGRTHE